MRAIIRCNTNATKESFQNILFTKKWWPPFEQEDSEVQKHREHIVSLVSAEDVAIVKKTVWFMVHSTTLRTWGLVNSPHPGSIEVRLRNQSSAQLRKACGQFITDLQSSSNSAGSPTGTAFEFTDTIEVLEPNSQHLAYEGEPLPTQRRLKWKLARRERRPEWVLGHILLGAAIFLMVLTVPPIQALVSKALAKDWVEWGNGTIGRVATSALASSAVSYVSVLIHFFDLRRLGAVRWTLKRGTDSRG